MIRKFSEAKDGGEKEVVVSGNGSATRDFLSVVEAAEGIILTAGRFDGSEPVNLEPGMEISNKDILELIDRLVGSLGALVWNARKPKGEP